MNLYVVCNIMLRDDRLTCSTVSLPIGAQKHVLRIGVILWCFRVMISLCPSLMSTRPSSGGVKPGQGWSPLHSSHSNTPRLYTSPLYTLQSKPIPLCGSQWLTRCGILVCISSGETQGR